ncbi:MAG: hypothetical protein U0610_05290 [bacterium]
MKLDLFAERRRKHPESQPDPEPTVSAPKPRGEPRPAARDEEPKSLTDRFKRFVEVLNQPIGATPGDDKGEKGKTKGKEGAASKRGAPEKPKSWAEEMGMQVPAKPADAKARQEADDAIAQGTYHLKRGNREPDVQKKIQCFEEALVHFRKLKELVPNDVSVAKQVEMVERGLSELRTAFERYRADHPEGPTRL